MGILDQFKGPLIRELMGLFQSQGGGLSGLVNKLRDSGLGDQVNSWISTGENKRVDSSQIKSALGSDTIQRIAAKLGISQDEAADGVADAMPEMVDKLTPNGKIEDDDNIFEKGLSSLKGLFN